MTTSIHHPANVERFAGFAPLYDSVRPQPPQAIVDILCQLAQVVRPRLVVDLGSGTGLSTRIWTEHAEQIVGIEPSADMRRQAESYMVTPNIRYQEGFSHQTGLSDACADIVTCSQSLHWMEPEPTFIEAARILRAGGVFAAYDCDWPPSVNVDVEMADRNFMRQSEELGEAQGFYRGVKRWHKDGHLSRMQASGCFRYVKEIVLHNKEMGDAQRLVGIALSQGAVASLLKQGLSEEEIGVNEFRDAIDRAIGNRVVPLWFSYRMKVGIK